MTIPQNLTSNQEINSNKIVTIKFEDATYTLKKFDYSGTTLTLNFVFDKTTGSAEPYKNSFSLSAFNIKGKVGEVKIKASKLVQPLYS